MEKKYNAKIHFEGLAVTDEQIASLTKIQDSDLYVGFSNAFPLLGCGGCVMVQCFYPSGGSITLGVENDGYTHS